MGANYVSRQFPASNFTAMSALVDEACAEDGANDGHSYSGSWGVKIGDGLKVIEPPSLFADMQAADHWLGETCDKWGELLAVKVFQPNPKALKGLDTILNTLALDRAKNSAALSGGGGWGNSSKQSTSLHNMVLARIKAGKSKLKQCPHCESRVAVKHLKSAHCPVCLTQEAFYTDSDRQKLIRLQSKKEALTENIRQLEAERTTLAKKQINDKTPWVWLVGASCSS